jgi:glycosidase
MKRTAARCAVLPAFLTACLASSAAAQQEAILQYFNTSWNEINARIPEVAEAGYGALWLPPPCKGASGTYSVGYDPLDRFDLGDRNQSGSVRTRYGTKAELLALVEKAHRFGIRVYFDNIMAHNAGPLGDVPPGTLFPDVPGFVPEDFHLVKRNGHWAKASDSINYSDEWQVLNRNPFAWDIAQENPNTSFNPAGGTEGQDYPKWRGIRQPGQTWYFFDTGLQIDTDGNGEPVYTFADKEPYQDTGWGPGNTGDGNRRFDWNDTDGDGQHDAGETSEPFTDTGIDPSHPDRRVAAWGFGDGRYNMGNPVTEDVNAMLNRAARYIVDQTKCDGFRLDAVKHVPSYFFGEQNAGSKDRSDTGYSGQIQEQFNVSHGYTDWNNHRDSNFDTTLGRDDAVLFGEHLGAPPNPDEYVAAGIRVANDDFLNNVGGFAGIGSTLQNYDTPGIFTKGVNTGMMYCLSHDNNSMAGSERPAAHQYMLLRAGLPIVYTDGYNVQGGPDYFPKPSYVPFLGQYGQTYVTGPLRVRRDFIRGQQIGRWSNQDFAAWEFRDKSENASMSNASATTVLITMRRNFTSGGGAPSGFTTTFPANTVLRNYSQHGGGFYAYAGNDGRIYDYDNNNVIVPSGGYFAFAPVVPEVTTAFAGSDSVRPITIQQNGVNCDIIDHPRKDGKDGDPAYAHNARIPRVTDASNLGFIARADGSCVNMLLKLDGGMDVNSHLGLGPQTGTRRDNPPGANPGDPDGMDLFVGWEQMQFDRRMTQKFAAENASRCVIGSPGAETWQVTIGQSSITTNQADGNAPTANTSTARWLTHDPRATHGIDGTLQFHPAPAAAASQPITVVAKIGYASDTLGSVKLYYTTDGTSYPEGSGSTGRGGTQWVNLTKVQNGTPDATGTPEWWRGSIPALPAGTVLRYKIGGYRTDAPVRGATDIDEVGRKSRMETIFDITGFNGNAVVYYPHNDKGVQATGLKEGLHVVRSRAFLSRSGQASLFNTWTQTFYVDRTRPAGLVSFPAQENDTIGGSTYGVVVLTDDQPREVWYSILDSSAANDSATNGNGASNWARAAAVSPPTNAAGTGFTNEWRFDYKNIPASGTAQIRVRLKELSSSTDNALSDVNGHFTTLTRTVNTGSPVNFAIAWPQQDGDTVGSGYVGKCVFNKSIGTGITDAQLLSEFTVTIASSISGEPDGETALPAGALAIVRNETATQDALAFTLPNLYNGDPDFLHHVRVVFRRADITLSDARLVKASPGALADADSDGLPDFWENVYQLEMDNPFGDNGPDGDPDGDGFDNATEYVFDTSPLDGSAAGMVGIRIVSDVNGSLTLSFPVLKSRRYQVQRSANLSTWANYGSEIAPAADNPDFAWIDLVPLPGRRFYRVSARVP